MDRTPTYFAVAGILAALMLVPYNLSLALDVSAVVLVLGVGLLVYRIKFRG